MDSSLLGISCSTTVGCTLFEPDIYNEGHALIFIIDMDRGRFFQCGAGFTLRKFNKYIGCILLDFPCWNEE
jgi:hypothetical protein